MQPISHIKEEFGRIARKNGSFGRDMKIMLTIE